MRRGTEGSARYLTAVPAELAARRWPVASGMPWGDIRSAGIQPSPGALHPGGDTYEAQHGPDPVRYPNGALLMTNVIWLDEAGIEALIADGAHSADHREMTTGDAEIPDDDGRCSRVYAWLEDQDFTDATPRGSRANAAVNYLKRMDAEGHRIGGFIDEVIAQLPRTSEADFEAMWATAPVPADTESYPRSCCTDPFPVPASGNGQAVTAVSPQAQPQGQPLNLLARMKNGTYLDSTEFAPLHYHVDGLVPEGLTVLDGAPKIGKSWLVLGWLLDMASVGKAILYLALEDSDRRMKWRCRQLGYSQIPAAFQYMTEEDVIPAALLATAAQFVRENFGRKPLIVVDTLQKAKQQTPRVRDEAAYERDYRVTSSLQALVKACPGAGLVVCHHDRKTGGEDWMDRVSGTKGITGGPDAVMYLERKRNEAAGTLHVTGRDIAENDYAVTFAGYRWTFDGGDLPAAAAAYVTRKAAERLGDRSGAIVAYAHETGTGGIGAQGVAGRLGITPNAATEYLCRLHESGRLRRTARGLYHCVCCVCSPPAQPGIPLPNTHNTQNLLASPGAREDRPAPPPQVVPNAVQQAIIDTLIGRQEAGGHG